MNQPIRKLLIANRGEIAVRIMNTARRMGITTVAIYSDADREALHVRTADEAYHIGPPAPGDSYLRLDKIIDIAKSANVDAIHPGYGFLSENAEFSDKIAEAGMIFVGPTAHAIETMGSKIAAKQAVREMNVPLVPGTEEALKDKQAAKSIAEEVGYPLLIKASAGGGGKGMRIAHVPEELSEQIERAMSEAQNAFGDSDVFLEKYIGQPRHIEVQVLFDEHGHGVYLLDRECSIQRRHQKVVEEAPANNIPDHVRHEMGEAALRVGRAVDYTGAGTVEFLMDADHRYYFLEMNTRLQVEHPVTEMITGVDLVEWQIRVAQGERLILQQQDISPSGHAIELRIYAEDPVEGFLPSTGSLDVFHVPAGEGIRLDTGYEMGQDIPIYYDPLIAKLICHADNRKACLALLQRVISKAKIEGIQTTLPFGGYLCQHPAFIEGRYTTHFVDKHFNQDEAHVTPHDSSLIAQIAAQIYDEHRSKHSAWV